MTNGIVIDNSGSNTIGVAPNETASFARNIIAGSTYSNVLVQGAQAQQNTVAGNYFDVASDGTSDFVNPLARGVTLTTGAHNNTVGGITNFVLAPNDIPEQLNHFGGEFFGILISDGATTNTVSLNLIDQCAIGIGIIRASNNTIGGDINKSRNVISNCADSGIFISDEDTSPPITRLSPEKPNEKVLLGKSLQSNGESSNRSMPPVPANPVSNARPNALTTGNNLQGNLVGTGTTGNRLPNARGIVVFKATGNFIGGSNNNFINVVSFNILGILLGEGANGNIVQRNRIGLDAPTGNQGAGNATSGVAIIGLNNQLYKNVIGDTDWTAFT